MNNLSLFILLILSKVSLAHENESGTIVVIGNKETQNKLTKIQNQSVIKKEVISRSEVAHKNASSLAKAVDLEPGVQTTLTCASCGSQRVTLNGMRGENTTVLIDGIPSFSTVSSFYGMEAIPMVSVDQIEILRGAGASLTAPESIGGVINIKTAPTNLNKAVYQVKGGEHQFLNQEFLGSYGNLRHGVVIASQKNLMGALDNDSNNVTESSRQSQQSVFLKNENRFFDNQLKTSFRIGYQELELLGGTTKAYRPTRYAANVDTNDYFGADRDIRNKYTGPLERIADRIDLNRADFGILLDYRMSENTQVKFSQSTAKQKQNSIYSHGYDYNNRDYFRFYDLNFNHSLTDKHFLTMGIDHKNETMISQSDYLYRVRNYKKDSFKFHTYGAYIQDEWYLNDEDEINLVLRFDQFHVRWADQRLRSTSLRKNAFSPRLHYKKSHNEKYFSRVALGLGYRAPLSMFESQHGTNEEGFELNITELEKAYNLTYTLNREEEMRSSAFSFAITKLESMAYANEESSPVLFLNANNSMNIGTVGLIHKEMVTPNWSLEFSTDWFILPDQYKDKLPTASQELRGRLVSDLHIKQHEIVTTMNVVGKRNLSPYGYHKNYNKLIDDPDVFSFDKLPRDQKSQKSPTFATFDIYYKYQKNFYSLFAGVNNLLDYTQTKSGESPLSWRTHRNHTHLDNRHVWGPNAGRLAYAGVKIEL